MVICLLWLHHFKRIKNDLGDDIKLKESTLKIQTLVLSMISNLLSILAQFLISFTCLIDFVSCSVWTETSKERLIHFSWISHQSGIPLVDVVHCQAQPRPGVLTCSASLAVRQRHAELAWFSFVYFSTLLNRRDGRCHEKGWLNIVGLLQW